MPHHRELPLTIFERKNLETICSGFCSQKVRWATVPSCSQDVLNRDYEIDVLFYVIPWLHVVS